MREEKRRDFKAIKEEYTCLREKERRKIIDHLANQKENGKPLFTKVSGQEYGSKYRYCGGSGVTKYGKGRLNKQGYNLENWKYIETKYKNKDIFISLQCFDVDPGSKNMHVLYDMIGLYVGNNTADIVNIDGIKVSSMFTKMKITNLELPLSEKDLNSLVETIKKQCEGEQGC